MMKNKQKTISGVIGTIGLLVLYLTLQDIFYKNLVVIFLSLALSYSLILIGKNDK